MDLYYEKNVINESVQNGDPRVKRYKTVRTTCIAVMAIGVMMCLWLLRWGDFLIIFNILIYASIIGPTTAGILITTRLLRKVNCEYDYIISGTEFRVIRIYDQKKRSKIVDVDFANVLQIGFTESEEFERIKQTPKLNKIIGFCNDQEDYLYILCHYNGAKSVVLCEYDVEFLGVLRKAAPSYGIFSDELRRMKL